MFCNPGEWKEEGLFLEAINVILTFTSCVLSFLFYSGEKKRVTIGVELMKRPRMLLMDEPTTGLDTSTAVELGKFWRILADKYEVFLHIGYHPLGFRFICI